VPSPTHGRYARPVGIQILTELAAEGYRIFDVAAFDKVAARHRVTLGFRRRVLQELEQSGWTARLKRGVYVIDGTQLSEPVHAFAIATQLVKPSAISGWSALHHHGLTDQVPHIITVMTTRKVQPPSMRTLRSAKERHLWMVMNLSIAFVTVTQSRFIGIEDIWVNAVDRAPITDRERTVLDLFLSPKRYGGIAEGISILEEHRDEIDLAVLLGYARSMGTVAVLKRLGWVLEHIGVDTRVTRPLREVPTQSWHLLDPTRGSSGIIDPRWHIRINT